MRLEDVSVDILESLRLTHRKAAPGNQLGTKRTVGL
jgi:hypothetical protein